MAKMKSTAIETAAQKMQRMVAEKQLSRRISDMEKGGIMTKYVIEFHDERDKSRVTSRWHYDLKKSMNGPWYVETLDYNEQPNAKE